MAFAEARAAWQRTANRCLVQEDAKRAPKFACCPSAPPSVKQTDTGPASASGGHDVPSKHSIPFNLNPSCSSLSPNSKWWLHLQPDHGYHKGLMDEQFNNLDCSMESSGALAMKEDDCGLVDETTSKKCSCDSQCRTITTDDKKEFGVQDDVGELVGALGAKVLGNGDEPYFDPTPSWVGAEKIVPWWRTADTDELASLVAKMSHDHVENCDLPRPQNTRVKKDVNVNMRCFTHHVVSSSLLDSKLGAENHHHYNNTHLHAGSANQKLSVSDENRSVSCADKAVRDIPTLEMHSSENEAGKTQLMEALRHSQTRAREAERAAKEASEEKEHVVKLVFRQASQLFAYKQWLHLQQLESIYLHFINNTSQSVSMAFQPMLPWTPQRTRKMRKSRQTSSNRKRDKQCCPQYEASKFALVFALGLGLAGAGFLLGWSIGWMLPAW